MFNIVREITDLGILKYVFRDLEAWSTKVILITQWKHALYLADRECPEQSQMTAYENHRHHVMEWVTPLKDQGPYKGLMGT